MPKLLEDGRYRVDIYPNGRKGKRIVRKFSSLEMALSFEADVKQKAAHGQIVSTQKEHLKDLIELWLIHYGQNLNSGVDRYKMMLNACEAMGNPLANRFNKTIFLKYRTARKGLVTDNTLNHELVYFRSMFNQLKKLDLFHFPNPLDGVSQLKTYDSELSFLSADEIPVLLDSLKIRRSLSAYYCSLICLATGCRWGEAERVKPKDFVNGLLRFSRTKNSKTRFVPVSSALEQSIKDCFKNGGHLSGAYSTFKVAFKQLELDVPSGQLTHILRHTFASHFIMNGGHILALQKILGHSDIKMTMRYSHLSPDYLKDALKLNPLAEITTL
jgi:integrase